MGIQRFFQKPLPIPSRNFILVIVDTTGLMVNGWFKSVCFLPKEIILWRKAPEKLRKQRTNFHQRFESPESQASAEQPEM